MPARGGAEGSDREAAISRGVPPRRSRARPPCALSLSRSSRRAASRSRTKSCRSGGVRSPLGGGRGGAAGHRDRAGDSGGGVHPRGVTEGTRPQSRCHGSEHQLGSGLKLPPFAGRTAIIFPAIRPPVPIQRCKQRGNRDWSEALREQRQRARIMQALVEVFAERGFGGTTVVLVVRRAGVSTRTFYRCFDGLEACLIAIMDGVLEEAGALVSRELLGTDSWQDGVRYALAAVLSYFDREPALACVCIVETLAGGPIVLTHRERLIETFRLLIVEQIERKLPGISPLATEGAMSLVLGIMHAHIVRGKSGPFIELLGPLMGLAMAPHLSAPSVQQEIERGMSSRGQSWPESPGGPRQHRPQITLRSRILRWPCSPTTRAPVALKNAYSSSPSIRARATVR